MARRRGWRDTGSALQVVGARSLCALEAQGALPVLRGDSFGDRCQSCGCLKMRLERFEHSIRHWRLLCYASAGAASPTGDHAALMVLPCCRALQGGSRTNASRGGGLLNSVGEVRWTSWTVSTLRAGWWQQAAAAGCAVGSPHGPAVPRTARPVYGLLGLLGDWVQRKTVTTPTFFIGTYFVFSTVFGF